MIDVESRRLSEKRGHKMTMMRRRRRRGSRRRKRRRRRSQLPFC